jgi:hypothetical protein
MKTRFQIALVIALVAPSLPAFAHDPSQHKAHESSGPDCAAMKDMDMSKMDMNDPVMKAMHDKCAAQMKHDDMDHGSMTHEGMKDMPGMNHDAPQPDSKGGK